MSMLHPWKKNGKVSLFPTDNDKIEEDQDFELSKLKNLLEIKDAIIKDKDTELNELKAQLYNNSQFMQTIVLELIHKREEKPKVSPAVEAYINKKNIDTTKSKLP